MLERVLTHMVMVSRSRLSVGYLMTCVEFCTEAGADGGRRSGENVAHQPMGMRAEHHPVNSL